MKTWPPSPFSSFYPLDNVLRGLTKPHTQQPYRQQPFCFFLISCCICIYIVKVAIFLSSMALRTAAPIWVGPIRPHSNVGASDLGYRRCGFSLGLRCNWDLERFPKWECCCLGVLAQRAITPVEDEKPFTPEVESSKAINQVEDSKSRGFHKDLNLLPSEFPRSQFWKLISSYFYLVN